MKPAEPPSIAPLSARQMTSVNARRLWGMRLREWSGGILIFLLLSIMLPVVWVFRPMHNMALNRELPLQPLQAGEAVVLSNLRQKQTCTISFRIQGQVVSLTQDIWTVSTAAWAARSTVVTVFYRVRKDGTIVVEAWQPLSSTKQLPIQSEDRRRQHEH